MRKYKQLEKACNMLLVDGRDLDFGGYSKTLKNQYDEDGRIKEDQDMRLNYDGEVVRVFIDGIFVFGVNNGWLFSYPLYKIKGKNTKEYIHKEFDKIIAGYKKQLTDDKEYIKDKFKEIK